MKYPIVKMKISCRGPGYKPYHLFIQKLTVLDWSITIVLSMQLFLMSKWFKPYRKMAAAHNGHEMDKAEMKRIYENARDLMVRQKIYLRKSIRLTDFARELGEREKLVSRSINHHAKVNFNLFVNNFRIDHAKELILSGRFDHYTIEAIAEESGFSNKVSFYQTFKKNTGMSPKKFRAARQP